MFKVFILVLSLFLLFSLTGCDEKADSVYDTTLYSSPDRDGVVIDATPHGFQYQSDQDWGNYRVYRIGWNASGHVKRAFLSFDLSSLYRAGKTPVIERAVLKVNEANTNLNPFADGAVMHAELIQYAGAPSETAFSASNSHSWVLMSSGYTATREHNITMEPSIIQPVIDSEAVDLQFRLRLSSDTGLKRDSNNQSIYASSEEQTSWRPALELRYRYE